MAKSRKKVDLPPSRPEVIPLLRDCKDQPEYDSPRLSLARWLEDRYDPRGEFVRLQVEAARRVSEGGRADDLYEQARTLSQQHREEWLGQLLQKGDFMFH